MRGLALFAALLSWATCSIPGSQQGAAATLTVTALGDGAGSLRSTPLGIDCGETCSAPFPIGTPIEVSALAMPGSIVGAWEGCPTERGSLCQITLQQDHTLRVRFDVDSGAPTTFVPFVIEQRGSGRVTLAPATPLACGASCRTDVAKSSWVQLTAVADRGNYFAGWGGGTCQGADPICNVFVRDAAQVIAQFSPQVCSHRSFCWENPIPTGSGVIGAYAVAEEDVWMATADQEGSLLRWNGIGWVAQPDSQIVGSVRPALTNFWASGRSDVWASDGQRLWHFDGAVYQVQSLPVAAVVRAVHGRTSDDVWAVGDNGAAFHCDGSSWIARPTGGTQTLLAVWVAPDGTAWAGGYNGSTGALLKWSGGAWSTVASPLTGGITRFSGSGVADVWAIASNGMLHFDGASWSEALTAPRLTDIQVLAANNIWGHNGAQVHHFDGTGWLAYTGPRVERIAATPRTVWVFEQNTGQIFRMVDGLILPMYPSIRLPRQPTLQRLRGVWMSDPDNAWAVGDAGTLLHHDGKSWTKVDSGTTEDLLTIHGTARDDIWIGGSASLLHYDGTTWRSLQGPVLAAFDRLYDLYSEPGGALWMLSEGAGVYRRTTTGALSTQFAGTQPSYPPPGCIFSLGPGSLWLGRQNRVYQWNGSAWVEQTAFNAGDYACGGGVSPTDFWVGNVTSFYWSHYNGSRVDRVLPASLFDDPVRRVLPLAADNLWAFGRSWNGLGHFDGTAWRFEPLTAVIGAGAMSGGRVLLVGSAGNILAYRP